MGLPNTKGKTLFKYLNNNTNLQIQLTNAPTRHGPNSSNSLDFFFYKNMNSTPAPLTLHELTSDHLPIFADIACSERHTSPEKTTYINHNSFIEKTAAELTNIPLKKLDTAEDLDELVHTLTHIIQDALTLSTATTQTKEANYLTLPPEIQTVITNRNRYRRYWQNTRNGNDRKMYKSLKKHAEKLIRKHRNERWETTISTL